MFATPWEKIITGIVLLNLLLPLAAAEKVEVSVEPRPVRVGEEAYLIIRSTDGTRNQPLGNRLPKVSGLNWLGGAMQSSQTHIINGRRSSVFELRIPFAVDKPGSYTIPAIILTHSKDATKKLTFEAVPARYQTTSQSRRRPDRTEAGSPAGWPAAEEAMLRWVGDSIHRISQEPLLHRHHPASRSRRQDRDSRVWHCASAQAPP